MSGESNGHEKSRLDRLEGLMESLIDDHLKFTDDLKRLLTAQVLLNDSQVRTTDSLLRITDSQLRITEAQERTQQQIQELAEDQKKLRESVDEDQKKLRKSLDELAEAQKHTDERLNALINIVDDLIRKRPNP